MLNVYYPAESFFYPYHLVAAGIAASIFGIILLALKLIKPKIPASSKGKPKGLLPDAISLATLVLALIASGLYPFLINPMLDYTVRYQSEDSSKIEEYLIDVNNWGLSPAKNVIVSVTSADTRFFNFTSEPFLGNYTKSNTSLQGNALYSISVLPPRSDTNINFNADTSKAKNYQQLKAFVRSDERVGYHDVLWTIVFYVGLGVIIVGMFIYLVVKKKLENLTTGKILKYMVPVAGWIIIFTGFYVLAYARKVFI